MSKVVIVDAGGANFASIEAALERLNVEFSISSDEQVIRSASHVILPGVGAAGHAMQKIHEKGLYEVLRSLTQPVLGICLGQQILCASSEEDNTACLDVIPLKVTQLQNVKIIPHMGWNNLTAISTDPLLKNISTEDDFYFVHSFAVECQKDYTLGRAHYGIEFAAIIKRDNFYGVQFHPEKSGAAGSRLLQNFLNL